MSNKRHFPSFPMTLVAAPGWARTGIESFVNLQSEKPGGLGFDHDVVLQNGSALYYPNVATPLGAGVIGVIIALCGFLGCGIVALTIGLMDSVPTWTLIGMGVSVLIGVLSFAFTAASSIRLDSGPRIDGMYLFPEGLVFVRKGRCACYERALVREFRVGGGLGEDRTSREEVVVFTDGVRIPLAPGEHPDLRATWEAWREGA